MRKLLTIFAIALGTTPAIATLHEGARAPQFVTSGALGGKPFKLDLAEQLRHGPVVLYFIPRHSPAAVHLRRMHSAKRCRNSPRRAQA